MVRSAPRYERDLYEVLGLGCDSSQEDIRRAYKKLALQYHPDKLLLHTGITEESATAQFQELLQAYEVLSDPKQRSKYDHQLSGQGVLQSVVVPKTRTKSASKPRPAPNYSGVPDLTADDLRAFFSDSAFSGYSDTGDGFYKVYSDLFEKMYAAEVRCARKTRQRVQGAPLLGNLDSPDTQVWAFYRYWLWFGEVTEPGEMPQDARREYCGMVRRLAEFVMERDKRVIGNYMDRTSVGLSRRGWRRRCWWRK